MADFAVAWASSRECWGTKFIGFEIGAVVVLSAGISLFFFPQANKPQVSSKARLIGKGLWINQTSWNSKEVHLPYQAGGNIGTYGDGLVSNFFTAV